ncbi:hypothetical protein F4821DRAFT_12405 [Hypoxylon rubiginosum]|uniref:Uncharacterized protein n=1 Tax=Hypoxylon rubiginosum TaxID=110542 RepID=A0ACC0DDQ2_9PEZI|nr:hypothetical protein F4821DRAFT_12405 [Hypoxylon rubiginosum]
MADRPPPHARPGTNRTARTNTVGVRRNLFQSQLTRRPTPTNSSSNTSAETIRLGDVEVLSDTSEIVIRDKNGEFEVDDPPTPPLDDPEEGGALDEAQENERERQRLAEAVRDHQINRHRTPEQPEDEVLEAVRASMRAKVAALAEDNWMYEPEEQPRPQ